MLICPIKILSNKNNFVLEVDIDIVENQALLYNTLCHQQLVRDQLELTKTKATH